MTLTYEQLKQIAPRARPEELSFLQSAMDLGEITTPKRQAMFLAQLAEECIEFTTFVEIWGPSSAQKRYERPRLPNGQLAPFATGKEVQPLWQILGNTEPGDGYRYRGRGGIQLTGRGNYERCSKALGVNFVATPDLAAMPEHRYRVSVWYWTEHRLNALSDDGDVYTVTRRINGPGMYGYAERQSYYGRALAALGAVAACGPT